MLSYTRERELILTIGQRMFAKDMVASNDGNISIRLSDDKYLITPTGVSKGFMRAEELCVIDGNGAVVEGSSRPSSEYKMHLEVYRRRRDVNACVHAHPRVATAFAVSRTELNKLSLPEVVKHPLGGLRFSLLCGAAPAGRGEDHGLRRSAACKSRSLNGGCHADGRLL